MENGYNKISLQNFARQINVGTISENKGLAVSIKPSTIQDHSFDFNYPHIVEGIAFILCVKGHGRILLNLNEYTLDKNSLLIVLPNNILQIKDQEELEAEFLFFTFDYISNLKLNQELGSIANDLGKRQCLKTHRSDFEDLLMFHKLVVKQINGNDIYKEDIVKNLIFTIVYRILQIYAVSITSNEKEHFSRKEEIYTKFITLLFEHYKTERSIQFYAGELFITPKYFSKVIREVSGHSASKFINDMVIMAAKSLLRGSDLTIAQIADELNFANPSFFGTYFKKITHQTPNEYRNP